MGRYIQDAQSFNISTLPLGSIAPIFRAGSDYRAVGEVLPRVNYSALSVAFPASGNFSSVATSFEVASEWVGVAYAAGLFVALSRTGEMVTSENGVSWIRRATLFNSGYELSGLSVANGKFHALSKGLNSTIPCRTSVDGIIWDAIANFPSAEWAEVTYSPELGMYVGVAKFDTTTTPATSSNIAASSTTGTGVWTKRTLPSAGNWCGVKWNGSIFAAVSSSQATTVATSPDGVTWTARTLPTTSATGLYAIAASAGLFVAVGNNSTILTSTDGINWVVRPTLFFSGGNFTGIVYGDGVFVAVDSAGLAYTSFDGIKWNKKLLPPVTGTGAAGYRYTAYGAGVVVALGAAPGTGTALAAAIYAENVSSSAYIYLSGQAGQFIRVK